MAALRTLAALRCCSESLAFRRGLVATLGGMRDPRAVELLVDMLATHCDAAGRILPPEADPAAVPTARAAA